MKKLLAMAGILCLAGSAFANMAPRSSPSVEDFGIVFAVAFFLATIAIPLLVVLHRVNIQGRLLAPASKFAGFAALIGVAALVALSKDWEMFGVFGMLTALLATLSISLLVALGRAKFSGEKTAVFAKLVSALFLAQSVMIAGLLGVLFVAIRLRVRLLYDFVMTIMPAIGFLCLLLSGLILPGLALTGRVSYKGRISALLGNVGMAFLAVGIPGGTALVLLAASAQWAAPLLIVFVIGLLLSGLILPGLALTGRVSYKGRRSILLGKAGMALLATGMYMLVFSLSAGMLSR